MGGRKRHFFRHGELHLVLLALLAERPQHGYDLLAELEARFAGRYSPSPGSVYPALASLADEGLIEAVEDAGRRVFTLTETGREALGVRRDLLASFEARTGVSVSVDGAVDAALSAFGRRVRAAGAPPERVAAALDEAAVRIERLGREER